MRCGNCGQSKDRSTDLSVLASQKSRLPCIANQTSVTRWGHYIAMVVGLGVAEFAVALLVYFIVKPTITRVGSKTDKVVALLGFSGRSGYI
jgi:hypothetical protein